MSNPSDKVNDAYLLGRIEATVTTTSEDVKAIRAEVGDLSKRVGNAETRLTEIETSREALLPEYLKHVHRVNNHMQMDAIWKANNEGKVKGGVTVGKAVAAVFGIILSAAAGAGAVKLVERPAAQPAAQPAPVTVAAPVSPAPHH